MKHVVLTTMLSWLTAALILRVLVAILTNYPSYFPPDFDSLFLQGREATFRGAYVVAFYVHILFAPAVLINGLILLNETMRRRRPRVHRWLGRAHVAVLLFLVLPSGAVMSLYAFAGWPAGLSFLILAVVIAVCTILGVVYARRHRYAQHRRWMNRSYVLICSAVALRLISGVAGLLGVSNPEAAYIAASWISWLLPLAAYEIIERVRLTAPAYKRSPVSPANATQMPS